jgi:hypothetical protein
MGKGNIHPHQAEAFEEVFAVPADKWLRFQEYYLEACKQAA